MSTMKTHVSSFRHSPGGLRVIAERLLYPGQHDEREHFGIGCISRRSATVHNEKRRVMRRLFKLRLVISKRHIVFFQKPMFRIWS